MLKHLIKPVSRSFAGLAGISATLMFASLAQAENYTVEMNKTQILRLPATASAIVVGNPEIADVSVHSPTLLFVIGRGYGTTNVIALDELGQTIMNADIQVKNAATPSSRRKYMVGKGWQSYDCAPLCQPAPTPGDAPSFSGQYGYSGTALNNSGVPATITPFGLSGPAGVPAGAPVAPNTPQPSAQNAPQNLNVSRRSGARRRARN